MHCGRSAWSTICAAVALRAARYARRVPVPSLGLCMTPHRWLETSVNLLHFTASWLSHHRRPLRRALRLWPLPDLPQLPT